MASGRSGGLDSRARAVPPPPLRSCGYWEEQRSAVTATAWRPLLLQAAEQALSWPVSAFRARIGRKVRKGRALPQVRSSGLGSGKIAQEFEFMPLTSAPGRIRTCAHGSGGRFAISH